MNPHDITKRFFYNVDIEYVSDIFRNHFSRCPPVSKSDGAEGGSAHPGPSSPSITLSIENLSTGDLILQLPPKGYAKFLLKVWPSPAYCHVGIVVRRTDELINLFHSPVLCAWTYPPLENSLSVIEEPITEWAQRYPTNIYVRKMDIPIALQQEIEKRIDRTPLRFIDPHPLLGAQLIADIFMGIGYFDKEVFKTTSDVVPSHFVRDFPILRMGSSLHLLQIPNLILREPSPEPFISKRDRLVLLCLQNIKSLVKGGYSQPQICNTDLLSSNNMVDSSGLSERLTIFLRTKHGALQSLPLEGVKKLLEIEDDLTVNIILLPA